MAITVRELVGLPHLRLELLAGESGLDGAVTWAHASDLDQPWRWLAGGELLMKNGRTFPSSESEQIAFLEHLRTAHISALVIGSDPESPPVEEGALRRADELELPVLKVPFSMSFIVLSRAVADALFSEEASRIARTEKIYDSIHAAVVSNDPGAFLARLEVELSCGLFIVDSETLSPILDHTPALPGGLRERIRDEMSAMGGTIPGVLRFTASRNVEIVVVEVPYEEPTLLVARLARRQAYDLVLLQHAATAVGVEVAHASLRADHQRQIGTELLSQLVEGRLDTVSGTAQLRLHALSPSSTRLLAISGGDANDERRLHIGLRRRGVAHLLLRRDRVLFLLLDQTWTGHGQEAPFSMMGLVLQRLGPGCTIGVSNVLVDPSRAPAAVREALWALASAAVESPVIDYDDASPLPGLPSSEEAQALVHRVLGPLIEYDHTNGTDLVLSLSIFLATQRSWQRCADRLHVHRQTVIYRMHRVEQITGRSLSETGDLAILWLAFSAAKILHLDDAAPDFV